MKSENVGNENGKKLKSRNSDKISLKSRREIAVFNAKIVMFRLNIQYSISQNC